MRFVATLSPMRKVKENANHMAGHEWKTRDQNEGAGRESWKTMGAPHKEKFLISLVWTSRRESVCYEH